MSRRPRCSSAIVRCESGAIMLLGVFMATFMAGMLFYAMGIGEAILHRQRMQDAADAGALSAAVMHARGMNLIVLINMVMAALLAVLVALRLVQLLALLAMTALFAASLVSGPALAGAIPAVRQVERGAANAYSKLKDPIFKALEVLNKTARVTRVVVPAVAQAGVLDSITSSYSPPAKVGFAIPSRFTLPVENDEYSVLCGKAGDYVGHVVTIPLDPVLPDIVRDEVSDAVGDLTESARSWFCGDGSSPSLNRRVRHVFPRLESRDRCEAFDKADPNASRAAYRAACQDVGDDEQASEPDYRGRCQARCEPGGPYEERVRLAREQCRPDPTDPRYSGYWWQERKVEVEIERVDDVWRETGRRTAGPELLVKRPASSRQHPCGSSDALYDPAWNERVHPPADPEAVLPVCTEPWEPPLLLAGDVETVEIVEVLHILRCERQISHQIHNSQDMGTGDDIRSNNVTGSDKSPQRVEQDVELGDDDFQLRVVVVGDAPSAGRAIRMVDWRDEATGPPAWGEASRFAVAQAEYYYNHDGTEDRAEWMWRMKWRARLKRVRFESDGKRPVGADDPDVEQWASGTPTTTESACKARAGSAEVCSGMESRLSGLNDLLVH